MINKKNKRWILTICIFMTTLFLYTMKPVFADNIDHSLNIPSGIHTTATHNKIIIKWDQVKDAKKSYEIEVDGKIIDNGRFTNYIHHELQSGKTYMFKIRSKKDEKYSEWSSLSLK